MPCNANATSPMITATCAPIRRSSSMAAHTSRFCPRTRLLWWFPITIRCSYLPRPVLDFLSEALSAFVSVSPLARHLRRGDGAAPGLRGAITRCSLITPAGIARGRIARLTFTPTPCRAIRAPDPPNAMSLRDVPQASARPGAPATSEWKSIGVKGRIRDPHPRRTSEPRPKEAVLFCFLQLRFLAESNLSDKIGFEPSNILAADIVLNPLLSPSALFILAFFADDELEHDTAGRCGSTGAAT